ncbi:MAG: alpha/beta fold hydrolase [Planctomycetota bacterium]|nr:alpha/beta fold hydrolase [Planctomycetota bacterium]
MRQSSLLIASIVFLAGPCLAQDSDKNQRAVQRFKSLDKNGDGVLTPDELPRKRLFKFMDKNNDGKIDLDEAKGVRKRMEEAKEAIAKQPKPSHSIAYHKVDGVDSRLLSLDIYSPKSEEETKSNAKRPVVVMIHGGGWAIGDKASKGVIHPKCADFLKKGYLFVSINYRLSPKVKHPVHVQDCARALAYIHDHIAEHGGNPEQMLVMGHSAGAHLAALVSIDDQYLKAHGKDLKIVKGVVLLDGAAYNVPTQIAASAGKERALKMYKDAFGTTDKEWRGASPTLHVKANKNVAPFLIFHAGDRKASEAQAKELGKTLEKAGYKASIEHAKDKTHSSMNRDLGKEKDKPTASIHKFFEGLLKTPPAKKEAPSSGK